MATMESFVNIEEVLKTLGRSKSLYSDNGRVVDNSALSLFHTCSGRRFEADEKEEYSCTIRQMTFGAVAHVDNAVISNLRFSSVFELAHLIPIFESEHDLDRKRFKMRNPSIVFITMSGAEKAYVFFKRFCDHMIRALMVHDGGRVAVSSNNGVDIDITQEQVIDRDLLFITTISDEATDESQWMRFLSVLAAVARDGIKLIAVCGPQGERGWQQNRQKLPTHLASFVKQQLR
ncbi:unnamed protein product [Heligmosomoides polygyrus]|uniref:TIR domain-containing protein n=1 Tax=Heligmosomoides polygyrus TaxID=6339 RepID=A0A3P8A5F6_HELPZ|nr:unnamed protein product [Heligmosomoides polygyrus]